MRKIRVKVRPNARSASLEELPDGAWVAHVKAPPVDGKANEELVALIARRFDLPKARITIRSGAGGRMKLVEIED